MSYAGNTSISETYYEILSVKEDASYEEIKAGYKLALLKSHPDKLLNDNDKELSHRFLNVQKAWEVLGNTQSRAVYDRQLNASRLDSMLAIQIAPNEMTMQNSSGCLELAYPCRCGDFFCIGSDELEEMGFTLDEKQGVRCPQGPIPECTAVDIPCFSCSLKVHLVLGSGSRCTTK